MLTLHKQQAKKKDKLAKTDVKRQAGKEGRKKESLNVKFKGFQFFSIASKT